METAALQQSLLSAQISVKFRYHRAFEMGMEQGAQAAALDMPDTGQMTGIRCGYHAVRENAAFAQGFDLGKDYIDAWRSSTDLLRLAIERGDVNPIDFRSACCPTSLNFYWQED